MAEKMITVNEEAVAHGHKPSTHILEYERPKWNNRIQFLITCVGYAVGLGNIWRFPSLAYENGGGAFLIPYLLCSFTFGLPIMYLEMCLGQYNNAGPGVVFGRVMPFLQGIGWCMVVISLLVGVYFNVIVAWFLSYLWMIVTGQYWKWSSCVNEWNTISCKSSMEDARCARELANGFYYNFTCHNDTRSLLNRNNFFNTTTPRSPSEEFFENFVLWKTAEVEVFGGMHWRMVAFLAFAWFMTAVCMIRGPKWMGRIAMVSATVPYVIIIILFFRAITLDGAEVGLRYFVIEPDFSYLWKVKTWNAAATQVCYTLAIGFGGLLSLSSFNDKTHNCYLDALVINAADGGMSIFGGVAVFAVLGFMAKQYNIRIDEVVQGGTGLAFIAYPEAMSLMVWPWLWPTLFFLMLTLLGLSSQFGMTEVIVTSICDHFKLNKQKHYVVSGICFTFFILGLPMCTRSGIFYFNIINDYSASFTLMMIVMLELVLIAWLYDLRNMFGQPKSRLSAIFGPSGSYVKYSLFIICPFCVAVISVFGFIDQWQNELVYGKGNNRYEYPKWATYLGWIISIFVLLFMPIFAIWNAIKFSRRGIDWRENFRVQPKWPAYSRIRGQGKVQPKTATGVNKRHSDPRDLIKLPKV